MKKSTLKGVAVVAFVFAALCSSGSGTPLKIDLPRRPSDGYGDVRQASLFGAEGKWDAGRAFIAELRARPAGKRNLEERQSVDMAEFALLRHDLKANKARHRQWILPPSYPTVRASPFELLAFMHMVYHITHNKTRKK